MKPNLTRRLGLKDQQVTHTHTLTENNTPDTHTHTTRITPKLPNKHPPRVNPNLTGRLGSTLAYEQALVSLKVKETVDVEVGRTKAVIIEGG